jgi:DNA-directed RNA polymerase specialized sigma24 family protein
VAPVQWMSSARRLVESLSTRCKIRSAYPMDLLDGSYDSRSSQPVTPDTLLRYRAERLLRKDFAGLRSKVHEIVRSQLRVKGITLDPSDLDACYAQAWQGLYSTVLHGEQVENPSAWLVLVTFRRAIDESRAAARIGVVEGEDMGSFSRRLSARAPDLAAELDDRARLRHVFEGMRTSLSKRECEAASLCYLQGLSRAEAAERIGISEARMRKLMEGAGAGRPGVARKVGELLGTIEAGRWCEQQSSLMRAFAFGVLDPAGERHTLAVAHCRECPACRAHVASLRGLAAVLPLPFFSPLALAGSGGTATSASGAESSVAGGGGGWGGLTGSLTVKLGVTAVVLTGGAYGLLGTRAHGSPSTRRTHLPSTVASEARLQALLPRLAPPVRHKRPIRPSSPARSRSVPTARSGGETSESEFLPERFRDGVPVASSTAPARRRNTSRSTREFGIE